MPTTILTRRQLNRATLARQMLLAREKITALRAIENLAGLQAQVPKPPFIGLWSRVEGFRRDDLIRLLKTRKVVRATLMRETLHLVSAKDFLLLRATMQPTFTQAMLAVLGARLKGIDIDRLLDVARPHVKEQTRTFNDIRMHLVGHFPTCDERAMGYAVRMHLPLVQVPTDDAWGFPGAAEFALGDQWLKKSVGVTPKIEVLVARYLAAFGPATSADMQTWSGIGKLEPVFDALRATLVTFRDERGRELFDLPKAPRPSADADAPIRFLPEFDNLVLAHADRTRIIADVHRPALVTKNLQVRAVFLIDGFAAGTWKIERKKNTATLLIDPFEKLAVKTHAGLESEGDALLRFVEPDADRRDVQLAKPK